ncbi:MAG: hypothetical protein ACYDGR_15810 [Candidatus Dormibacteria bacterium]
MVIPAFDPVVLAVASGGVGAVLTVIGMALLQVWSFSAGKRAARSAGRLIYLEVLYNMDMLAAGQATRPALFYVSHRAWDRFAPALAPILNEAEIAAVGAPYISMPIVERVLAGRGLNMAVLRLHRADRLAMENMGAGFGEAEKVLRAKLWSGKRQRGLEAVIKKRALPTQAGVLDGIRDVLYSGLVKVLPVAFLVAVVLTWPKRLQGAARTFRRWLGDTEP